MGYGSSASIRSEVFNQLKQETDIDRATAIGILTYYKETATIDTYIRKHWKRAEGSKIRRGVVSSQVAKDLGITMNPANHEKIASTMKSMGVRRIMINGKAYWGELEAFQNIICEETET